MSVVLMTVSPYKGSCKEKAERTVPYYTLFEIIIARKVNKNITKHLNHSLINTYK